MVPANPTVSARNEILAAIAGSRPPHVDLPVPGGFPIHRADLIDRFADELIAIGGECIPLSGRAALQDELRLRIAGRSRVMSTVRGIRYGEFDVEKMTSSDLATVEVAVVPSELAVAENGAVWLDEVHLTHRVLSVIVESLIVVVSADSIVADMHHAYAALGARLPTFGQFVAGPSKTADIEQSLVVGAHGAREMTVLITL